MAAFLVQGEAPIDFSSPEMRITDVVRALDVTGAFQLGTFLDEILDVTVVEVNAGDTAIAHEQFFEAGLDTFGFFRIQGGIAPLIRIAGIPCLALDQRIQLVEFRQLERLRIAGAEIEVVENRPT